MKKIVDVVLNIDSLILEDNQCIDDVIKHIQNKFELGYEPTYMILYEEFIDD